MLQFKNPIDPWPITFKKPPKAKRLCAAALCAKVIAANSHPILQHLQHAMVRMRSHRRQHIFTQIYGSDPLSSFKERAFIEGQIGLWLEACIFWPVNEYSHSLLQLFGGND